MNQLIVTLSHRQGYRQGYRISKSDAKNGSRIHAENEVKKEA